MVRSKESTIRSGTIFDAKGIRNTSLSEATIDSQTVYTTERGGERGDDAGTKVSCRKRHIAVDRLGLVLAVVVHPANVQDYDGAVLALRALNQQKVLLAGSTYRRNNLRKCLKTAFAWLLQTVFRPVNGQGFVVLPKRWIVERILAWLGRGHSKDVEWNTASSETMKYSTASHLILRRLARARA